MLPEAPESSNKVAESDAAAIAVWQLEVAWGTDEGDDIGPSAGTADGAIGHELKNGPTE